MNSTVVMPRYRCACSSTRAANSSGLSTPSASRSDLRSSDIGGPFVPQVSTNLADAVGCEARSLHPDQLADTASDRPADAVQGSPFGREHVGGIPATDLIDGPLPVVGGKRNLRVLVGAVLPPAPGGHFLRRGSSNCCPPMVRNRSSLRCHDAASSGGTSSPGIVRRKPRAMASRTSSRAHFPGQSMCSMVGPAPQPLNGLRMVAPVV